MEVLLFFALLILVYLAPAFIASARGHHQTMAIFVLNLFLGWTLLGWVGALVWADGTGICQNHRDGRA
jgi:hypothetical protein